MIGSDGLPPQGARPRALHGRRKGKALRAGQRNLVDNVLPILRLDSGAPPNRLDPALLFRGERGRSPETIWLEIGFGHGEHLAFQLRRHADVAILGAEYFVNGIARLLSVLSKDWANLQPTQWPVRIFPDDARSLLTRLPPASIGRAFILHPDPWPKVRHHKRRIVSSPTLDALAACLVDGAELRMATDDPGYGAWMLDRGLSHPAFEWTAETAADWRHDGANRPDDWPPTRYETKALKAGRPCTLLRFRRRPRA